MFILKVRNFFYFNICTIFNFLLKRINVFQTENKKKALIYMNNKYIYKAFQAKAYGVHIVLSNMESKLNVHLTAAIKLFATMT